ncbi:hypothetical protein AVEN_96169-1 [Araneus ventricosus]|uniref:Transposable element P transposase-like RNase H domain-containing protein n=1 Tax=Araneus ventricosus TaxID=182803 RepID=A0A4Y2H986_ARAVE|nr:hypothetical protein AVEN_96169-1 [Araneus ventricosus]
MFSPHEKLICLLIDEIYVNPGLDYKGGKLLGKAENANQQANTIQAFMITSLFSKYKEIIALVPMKNQTADDLYCQTLKVLKLLNDCKYNVLSLISDNPDVPRNLVNCISNPVQPDRPSGRVWASESKDLEFGTQCFPRSSTYVAYEFCHLESNVLTVAGTGSVESWGLAQLSSS